jgi:hypothetical protein
MIKGNLMNNTKTRRKGSMLQDSLSKIKYFLVLAVLLVLPMQAMAQYGDSIPVIDQTDTGVNRLVAFWDTRTRDTYIQVTNTSTEKVSIHVQVFDADSGFTPCEECNWDDMLTAFDTHVYDIENLVTNSVPGMSSVTVCPERPGTYGFMVISLTDGPDGSLIGMFRIIDESGYEYRANAAGTEDRASFNSVDEVVNFSSANGNILSDLVGITYVDLQQSDGTVYASPGVTTTFGTPFDPVLIYDEVEFDTSCSPTSFSCAPGLLDRGVDNSLPNSKGEANRVCTTSVLNTNSSGWLDLPFDGFYCTDSQVGNPVDGICEYPPYFVGFIGLNNGDGTGSMDSWWETGLLKRVYMEPMPAESL